MIYRKNLKNHITLNKTDLHSIYELSKFVQMQNHPSHTDYLLGREAGSYISNVHRNRLIFDEETVSCTEEINQYKPHNIDHDELGDRISF